MCIKHADTQGQLSSAACEIVKNLAEMSKQHNSQEVHQLEEASLQVKA